MTVAAFLGYRVVRGVGGPILRAWTNQQLESEVRATVFSMRAQVHAFSQVVSGPVMGVVANNMSVRLSLFAAAALLTAPQAIYA